MSIKNSISIRNDYALIWNHTTGTHDMYLLTDAKTRNDRIATVGVSKVAGKAFSDINESMAYDWGADQDE